MGTSSICGKYPFTGIELMILNYRLKLGEKAGRTISFATLKSRGDT